MQKRITKEKIEKEKVDRELAEIRKVKQEEKKMYMLAGLERCLSKTVLAYDS